MPASTPGGKRLTREAIVSALTAALKPLEYVRAFWEGGAASFERVDRWSDIDLYAFIRDGKTDQVFQKIEETLRKLSPISDTYSVTSGWEGVEQKFYTLERASRFLIVDLALVTDRSTERFLTPEIHGKNVFYFDKDAIARRGQFERVAFDKEIDKRRERLDQRFRMFESEVLKELNRGHSLEALEEYRAITLGTLVELLRMRYGPVHYNFRMRYVHQELPLAVVRRLEALSYVRDIDDIRKKHAEAAAWIRKLLSEERAGADR